MHEGCEPDVRPRRRPERVPLPRGRQFLTGPADDPETLVFESLHDLAARPEHNRIELYTWTDQQCCLPRGIHPGHFAGDPPIVVGDFLLLEEVAGTASGAPQDADRSHRHVVRLTEVTPGTDPLDGTPVVEVAWARTRTRSVPVLRQR